MIAGTEEEEEDLQMQEFIKNLEENETVEPPATNVVVVGGSNCIDVEKMLTGDQELKVVTTNLSTSGMMMHDIGSAYEDLDGKEKEQVTKVITHVGSCDFPMTQEDIDRKLKVYMRELNFIQVASPTAEIIISGIISRSGNSSGRQEVNRQIDDFNKRLFDLANGDKRLHFCSNRSYLQDKEGVFEHLYRKDDPEGVHLNEEGKKALTSSWLEEVKVIFSKHFALATGFREEVRATPV